MEIVTEYVSVDNYRLDNAPLDIKPSPELLSEVSLLRYCNILCLLTVDCRAVSTKYDGSACELHNISLSAPGALAVYNVNWKTYLPGRVHSQSMTKLHLGQVFSCWSNVG